MSGRHRLGIHVHFYNTDDNGIGDACNGLNIATFVDDMNNYIAGLGLPGGLKNALQNKLNQVRTRYCAGNIADAISKLNAFMNQVSGLRGNQIPPADADYLLAQAQMLMDAIVAGTAVCPSEDRSLVMQDQNAVTIGLSPNPAAYMVQLDLSAFEGSACTIRMVDVYGRLAQQITVDAAVREPLQVDLKGMTTGIYLIQVQATTLGKNGESKHAQVSRLMVQQD